MAVHDQHYASPPSDWVALTYRLQLLSEQKLGTRIRAEAAAEDAASAAATVALKD